MGLGEEGLKLGQGVLVSGEGEMRPEEGSGGEEGRRTTHQACEPAQTVAWFYLWPAGGQTGTWAGDRQWAGGRSWVLPCNLEVFSGNQPESLELEPHWLK